jgi:hypothetical protein
MVELRPAIKAVHALIEGRKRRERRDRRVGRRGDMWGFWKKCLNINGER